MQYARRTLGRPRRLSPLRRNRRHDRDGHGGSPRYADGGYYPRKRRRGKLGRKPSLLSRGRLDWSRHNLVPSATPNFGRSGLTLKQTHSTKKPRWTRSKVSVALIADMSQRMRKKPFKSLAKPSLENSALARTKWGKPNWTTIVGKQSTRSFAWFISRRVLPLSFCLCGGDCFEKPNQIS